MTGSDRTIVVPPHSGVALALSGGEVLRFAGNEDCRVCGLVAFGGEDMLEVISNGQTLRNEGTLELGNGNVLWSDRANPLLEILDASAGDVVLKPSTKVSFFDCDPKERIQDEGMGNLAAELVPFGIFPDDVPRAFQVYMKRPGGGSDRPSASRRTALDAARPAFVRLRAMRDLIVGLAGCPAHAVGRASLRTVGGV